MTTTPDTPAQDAIAQVLTHLELTDIPYGDTYEADDYGDAFRVTGGGARYLVLGAIVVPYRERNQPADIAAAYEVARMRRAIATVITTLPDEPAADAAYFAASPYEDGYIVTHVNPARGGSSYVTLGEQVRQFDHHNGARAAYDEMAG